MSKKGVITYDIAASFDYSRLPRFGWNVCVGKRGTGKTTLAMHLARKSPRAFTGIQIAICGSAKVKKDWSKIVHPMNVHDPSREFLRSLIEKQNALFEHYGEADFPPELEIDLFIDDCGALDKFIKSEEMLYLAANGKHLFINTYTCLQYIYMFITKIRENIDFLFIRATANINNIKTFQREILSCVPLRDVTAIVKKITANYGTLVLDNVRNAMCVEQICSSLKLSVLDLKDTRVLGSPSFRKWADEHYREKVKKILEKMQEARADNSDEDEEEENDMDLSGSLDDKDSQQPTTYSDRFGRIIVREIKSEKND